jgi:predicted HAD superfamily Cof-like phosphohydrolase
MKMTNFEKVIEFHKLTELPVGERPNVIYPLRFSFRKRLIDEEYAELLEAYYDGDINQIAKEGCDLLYVVYGLLIESGIDADKVFDAVHKSNMTKLEICTDCFSGDSCETCQGKGVYVKRREDGKPLKGSNYTPPDIGAVLCEQVLTVN